eukprot:tig00001471_g8879.t1
MRRLAIRLALLAALLVCAAASTAHPGAADLHSATDDDVAVESFRAYLRIRTDQPKPKYREAVAFLLKEAESFGLQHEVIELEKNVPAGEEGKPAVLLTLPGADPSLPAVVFNSHMDVVPAEDAKWTHAPFGAEMDEEGRIFARGSQDMKNVGIQHLHALGRLKREGFAPLRTLHALFVPDEEIGGVNGMQRLVKTKRFQRLHAGLFVDEGLASTGPETPVYYGERAPWWVRVRVQGPPGHGSMLIDGTAMEKLNRIVQRFLGAREGEVARLKGEGLPLGDVTTINLTYLKGGLTKNCGESYAMNVIPGEAEAGFDLRIPPTEDMPALRARIDAWVHAEANASYDFVEYTPQNPLTPLDDEKNPWWPVFRRACERLNVTLKPAIFPAATDARFVRGAGLPALGFSPMAGTPVLLHDHDEHLPRGTFLHGLRVFQGLMRDLGTAPAPPPPMLAP